MLSRFFGKRDQADQSPTKEAQDTRGLEVIEDDPDTAWSMWDSALAAQSAAEPSPSAGEEQPDFTVPTEPMGLNQLSLEQRKSRALFTVEQHHQRIANTIRTLWGYKECSIYINKLIMAGGDGMGHARVGFNQDAVEAMLALSDLHDAEFGPPDTGGSMGFSI